MKETLTEHVRPVIEQFFDDLKPEQWRGLQSGNPDLATKYILAEFIVSLIEIMCKHFRSTQQNTNIAVSEANVYSEMSNMLPQIFAEALEVDFVRHTPSVDSLASLIAKEVMLSFEAELSSSSSSSREGLCSRVVPPKRLNNMILLASRMIKSFIRKMDHLCGCRRQSQMSDTSDLEITEEQDKKLEEIIMEADMIGSQDSLNTTTLKTVKYVMKKATAELTKPLLDPKEPQYKKVLSDAIEESKKLSVELTAFLKKQCNKKCQPLLQEAGIKMKTFFAKYFAKLTILRSAAKLRAKFWGKSRTDSSESVEKLVKSVDSLLQTEKSQSCDLETLRSISVGSFLQFTEQLRDLLFDYVSHSDQQLDVERTKTCAVYVRSSVANFFAFMRWWLITQNDPYSQRVIDLIISAIRPRIQPAQDASGRDFYDPRAQQRECMSIPEFHDQRTQPTSHVQFPPEMRKVFIGQVLHKLLTRATKKANIHCTYACIKYHNWLLEEVWTKLQDTEHITPENLKNIEKYILEELCNYCGGVEHVLAFMEVGNKAIIKIIADTLVQHLTKPKKKRSAIVRFFSTLGKAITKPFRSEKVYPASRPVSAGIGSSPLATLKRISRSMEESIHLAENEYII